MFVTVGGGGLISGVSSYIKSVYPETKVIGVEPAGAQSMKESLKKGRVVKLEKSSPLWTERRSSRWGI